MNSDSLIAQPQQARSRDSLARIEHAAERLMERTDFALLSISAITREAGVSVGSFYTRFRDKEALLLALHQRYERERTAAARRFCDREATVDAPLRDRCERLVGLLVGLFRKRRAVLRSFMMRVRAEPHRAGDRRTETLHGIYDDLVTVLLQSRAEIAHPDPAQAARFAILLAGATCRNKIIFGDDPHPSSVELSDTALAAELTHALVAYLGSEPQAAGSAKNVGGFE